MVFSCACVGKEKSRKEYIVNTEVAYLTLEQIIDNSTHIVEAKHIESSSSGKYLIHKFMTVSQIKGKVEDEYIYVYDTVGNSYVSDIGVSYKSNVEYKKGENYILMLEKTVSVYYPTDVYMTYSGLYLPLNNIKALKIYGKENLKKHSAADNTVFESKNSFVEYVDRLAKEDKTTVTHVGEEYTKSSEHSVILQEAEYVVKIRPVFLDEKRSNEFSELYDCEVLRAYKGIISKEKIQIRLFTDSVEINKDYIVAINDTSIKDLYILSSKNSMFDVTEETTLLKELP